MSDVFDQESRNALTAYRMEQADEAISDAELSSDVWLAFCAEGIG